MMMIIIKYPLYLRSAICGFGGFFNNLIATRREATKRARGGKQKPWIHDPQIMLDHCVETVRPFQNDSDLVHGTWLDHCKSFFWGLTQHNLAGLSSSFLLTRLRSQWPRLFCWRCCSRSCLRKLLPLGRALAWRLGGASLWVTRGTCRVPTQRLPSRSPPTGWSATAWRLWAWCPPPRRALSSAAAQGQRASSTTPSESTNSRITPNLLVWDQLVLARPALGLNKPYGNQPYGTPCLPARCECPLACRL